MRLSDNTRGAIYMNVAMLAFTLNDSLVKAVTATLPLFQAIALRGAVATAALSPRDLPDRACKLAAA